MTRFSLTTIVSSRKYLWVVVATLALLASGCSRMGKSRPDTQVAADVKSRIEADAGVPDKQVTINASNGVVTLSGRVSSDAARNAAAQDAAQVQGVKTVVNNLQVVATVAAETESAEPPVQTEPSDKPSPRRDEGRPSPRKPARGTEARSSAPADADNGEYDPGVTVTTAENNAETSGNNVGGSGESQENSTQEPPPPPAPASSSVSVQSVTVPAGTKLAIHLNEPLSSETAQVGDVFHGSIATPVSVDGQVVIPTSADVEGRVVDVKPAGRFKGQSDLAIEITRIMMNGKSYSVVTDRWSKAGLARGKATARKVGGGAAIGAVLGGIFGGGRGAAIGAAAGAGAGTGVAGAGKGQEIVLNPETVLNFQLQNPVTVTPGVSRPSLGAKQ
ncbi:MAG: BON domain-containing protein [Terriglobales bacterium]